MDYNAENVKYGKPDPEKYKVFFNVKTKEDALRCFKDFNTSKRIISGARHKLYYVRPDEIFLKYADIEAEKYYAE